MSNMNPEMQNQLEYQRLQLIGSITHIANSMREAAAAADQMLNSLTYGGTNPVAFPQLPNGQYHMPVMPPMPIAQDEHGKKRKSRGGDDADGKRKVKKIKDPNAPKRPPSSYLLFQNEVRSELKAQNPGLRNNELLGAIAKKWSEMPQEQKDEYERRNRAAKDKWLAQKAVYESGKTGEAPVPVMAAVPAAAALIAPNPIPVAAAPVAAATDTSEEEDDDEEASSGSPDASSGDETTPPPAPKKAKKEVAAPTPAKEEGKKEKKHKKAKA